MILLVPLLIGMVIYVAVEARRSNSVHVEKHIVSDAGLTVGAVRSLAFVEAKRLLRSPVFLSGVLMYGLAGFVIGFRQLTVLHKTDSLLGLLFFPLAGMALFATNLAVQRGKRDAAEELFGTLPVGREARTLAHALSALAGAVVAVGLVCVSLAIWVAWGTTGTPHVAELLVGPVLVLCAGIVGVSAARIIPTTGFGGMLALVAMGVIQGVTDHYAHEEEHVSHWFSFWVSQPEGWPADMLSRRPWPHLVYLLALGSFALVCGLLRHRRDRVVWIALAASVAIAAGAGIVQAQPRTDAEWDRVASWLVEPAKHQTCVSRSAITFCSYDGYEGMRAKWMDVVPAVAALVPQHARARLTEVRQRVPASSLWQTPKHVKARIAPLGAQGTMWPEDAGAVHTTTEWCDERCALSLGVQTGALLVGLPQQAAYRGGDGPESDPVVRFDTSGSARGLVALWLGAQASVGTQEAFLRAATRTMPSDSESGDPNAPVPFEGCGGVSDVGTVFGRGDITLAAQMVRLPRADVAASVAREWDRLVDPGTPASAVVDLLDLKVVAPPAGVFHFC